MISEDIRADALIKMVLLLGNSENTVLCMYMFIDLETPQALLYPLTTLHPPVPA